MEDRDSRRIVRVFGVGLIVVLAAGAVAAPGPAGGRGGYGPGGGGTPTPTPTATATATATPTSQPSDTTPPSVNSRIGRGQTARSILKKGLLLTVQCSEDCRHQTRLFVNKKTARKLGIKKNAKGRVQIGQKTVLLKASVGRKIRVTLNRKAKQGIRRMKRKHVRQLQLTIATAARDGAGNLRRSTQTQTFKR